MYEVSEIIEALGQHEDESAINVLDEVGTNSGNERIRELTAKALVERNTYNSLEVVINREGKGINDLSRDVSESAIEALRSLPDKSEVIRVLDATINRLENEILRQRAVEVKDLILSK